MYKGLSGKKIILGITGSIAAYKSAVLTRLFIKSGAEVKVIMTESATEFIRPLTLATLSRNSVITHVATSDQWNNHVELGLWADALVIAPLTANTLARLANGLSDDMLTATYLSAKCPVFLAPAMDLDMWKHPSTTANLEKVRSYGNTVLPVGHGELASGLIGDGRMAEPEIIASFLAEHIGADMPLAGKHIMITAGPTQEPIDPVRYIGNRSTGKMGIALAESAAQMGARVTLIIGPTHLAIPESVKSVHVHTANEMYEAAMNVFEACDIAIMAAAVADYTPVESSKRKIKKRGDRTTLELKETPDIAASLGAIKKDQIMIGFALETDNEIFNAKEKLHKKHFDFIVLNSLNDEGAGFGYDTNKVTIIKPDGSHEAYPLKSKKEVSRDILDCLTEVLESYETI